MRYPLLFLLLSIWAYGFMFAEKIAEIKEIFQYPVLAAVDDDKFYIYDGKAVTVHMYSRKDFHLMGKFGGLGEGPSEFKYINHLRPYPEYIFISSGDKISYFSPTGKLQKEIKTPYAFSTYFPLARNFVCKKYQGPFEKQTISIKFLDPQLKEIKELESFQSDYCPATSNGKMNFVVVRDFFGYTVDEDRLFVGNTKKGFHFTIYDGNGDKQYQIDRAYQKRLITAKDKEEELKSLLEEVGEVRFEQSRRKYNLLYPEYFPAYSVFTVNDGKLYILIYPRKSEQQDLVVLDTKGNFLKQLQVYTRFGSTELCVFKGAYYYLKVNEDTDNWEFHEIRIFD